MSGSVYLVAKPRSERLRAAAGDYLALTKPAIVLQLVITGYCAMVVAAGGLPRGATALWGLLGLALCCGGACAVNMWYDRDIDQLMVRTQDRPVPGGRLSATNALAFGVACEIVAVAVLALAVNPLSAVLALGGFVYYVFVYTMWLKRRTPQNIVIGGGAGAFPPLIGWAAVTGTVAPAALLMFLIVFLWTPPHFWALALYRQDDYKRAGIPMMPVVCGERATKWQGLGYAVALLGASVLLYWTGAVGRIYLMLAIVLGVAFIGHSVVLLVERMPEVRWARKTFRFSLLYLTGLFLGMVLNVHH